MSHGGKSNEENEKALEKEKDFGRDQVKVTWDDRENMNKENETENVMAARKLGDHAKRRK